MNKEFVELFISEIEKLMKVSGEKEYVQDELGIYWKASYLKHLMVR